MIRIQLRPFCERIEVVEGSMGRVEGRMEAVVARRRGDLEGWRGQYRVWI